MYFFEQISCFTRDRLFLIGFFCRIILLFFRKFLLNKALIESMLTESLIERNKAIVRKNLIRQMKLSLKVGNDLIDEEMNGLAIIFRPTVKMFYNALVKKDLEAGTINTIDLNLETTKKMLTNGVKLESDEFYAELEKIFPQYLKEDQTYRQCKRDHKNFPFLKENLKRTFKYQMIPLYRLLAVEKEGMQTYDDLCREAFPTKEECRNILLAQLDSMKDGLKVIQKDLSILDIITARETIFRVLKKGFDRKTKDFLEEIEEIYKDVPSSEPEPAEQKPDSSDKEVIDYDEDFF